jgi:hypothetical protein
MVETATSRERQREEVISGVAALRLTEPGVTVAPEAALPTLRTVAVVPNLVQVGSAQRLNAGHDIETAFPTRWLDRQNSWLGEAMQ